MLPEDVTDDMLKAASLVTKAALKPKKSPSEERRRLEALQSARIVYAQRYKTAEVTAKALLTAEQLEAFGYKYEAITGARDFETFLRSSCGFEGLLFQIEIATLSIRDAEQKARIAAALKGTLQEAIQNEPNGSRRRLLRIKMATPAWVDYEAMAEIYRERDAVSRATGIEHHVDHIYPLAGKTVCGLHVHHNMRIITAAENLKKSAKVLEIA
jgi:hypothetical protein